MGETYQFDFRNCLFLSHTSKKLNQQQNIKLMMRNIYVGCTFFYFFSVEELYYKLNCHDQKIQQTLVHNIQRHWTAVSTLLGLSSSVYRDHPTGD